MDLIETLNQGIAAAQAGNKHEAQRLLRIVVKSDETHVEAWLWLSQIVDSLEEREICFENILTLEPDNQIALEALAEVQAQRERFHQSGYLVEDEEKEAVIQPVPDAEVDLAAQESEFENPWLCPYCLASTQPKDEHCPACRQPLIVRRRVKEDRTVTLWRAIMLQWTVFFMTLAIGAGLFTLILKLNGVSNPLPFVLLYFWQPITQPDDVSQLVLSLFPRWVFLGLIAFSLYSLGVMLLLAVRVPNAHVIYLVSGYSLLALSVLGVFLFFNASFGLGAMMVGIMLGAAQILLSNGLWDDFTFKQGRLRLKLDRDARTNVSLFQSGRKYMKLGMWGMALIHLRQVVFRAPQNVTYLSTLVLVYLRVKRYDLAEQSLKRLEEVAPNAPESRALRQELNKPNERA